MTDGEMMDQPLLISQMIEFANLYHSKSEIVTRKVEDNSIHRYTYGDACKRSRQLANALISLGVKPGDTIATLAWNTFRHYEAYYGISGIGAITHTINPRLFAEQLTYIINHAEDQYIMVDLSFIKLLESVADKIPNVKGFIVFSDREHMPETSLENVICYEEFIAKASSDITWPEFSENTAAALCYTSGTTGNPKGVLYSHRSTVLHAYGGALPDALNISSRSSVLPVVPMFHVNAWGMPYACTMTGAKLVFPGAGMDGESLYELINQEQATTLLGVPTVWLGLLNFLRDKDKTLSTVDKVVIGGAAAPLSMIKELEEQHNCFAIHAWGMTEMSPLGTICSMTKAMESLPKEQRYQIQLKQGRPVFGVEMKIVDDDGNELARDGKSFGQLLVKGPWIIKKYFKNDESALINGWFDTGDVATLDPEGYMQIVDRKKDVIKSGGEWISSIEIENIAVGHADVLEACVIGVAHPKWDERPLLLIVKNENGQCDEKQILSFLEDKIAKWWMPDEVIFVNELPHSATGKLLKIKLREEYKDHLINQS